MKLTKQQIEKAVSWWGEVLKNPKYDNGDDSEAGIVNSALAYNWRTEPSNKDIKKFKSNLTKILEEDRCSLHSFALTCDYHPCKDLLEATKGTRLNEGNFPWKTEMIFREGGKVLVSYGYGSPWKEL